MLRFATSKHLSLGKQLFLTRYQSVLLAVLSKALHTAYHLSTLKCIVNAMIHGLVSTNSSLDQNLLSFLLSVIHS